MGGLDVKAEDIIDIIEGYKGKGYAISSQEELGKYINHFSLDNIVTFRNYTQCTDVSALLYSNLVWFQGLGQ